MSLVFNQSLFAPALINSYLLQVFLESGIPGLYSSVSERLVNLALQNTHEIRPENVAGRLSVWI